MADTQSTPETTLETIKIVATNSQHGIWGAAGINEHLIAVIYAETRDNVENDDRKVVGLLENAEFSLENQYSTPFENSNPEGRMPNMMGLIQSGQIAIQATEVLGAFGNIGKVEVERIPETDASAESTENIGSSETTTEDNEKKQGGAIESLLELKGRSSFTKLNSEQIYTSSNSVRINATLVLSAWKDAKAEVEKAIQTLQEWTAPVELSENGLLANMAQEKSLKGLFPSVIPITVRLDYGGKMYNDLVIESLSVPMTAPMNSDGSRITAKVQINFLSRRAWDRKDVTELYS
ncbi:hypothetical protein ACGTJS_10980 [Faucicola mancuniensis]|uniref:hypothetical protein n=1 Tax=Faucicola mancuniensis TaxID=1309795 RepID=UPI0039773590